VQPPRGRHGSQRIPELGFDRADAGLRESRFVDDHEGVDADLRQATHLPGRVRRQPHADVTGERDDARARPHATGATLQRDRQRDRTGDLQLDHPVIGRLRRGLLSITVGRPAAAARVGSEPLAHHVAVQPRQLRPERRRSAFETA